MFTRARAAAAQSVPFPADKIVKLHPSIIVWRLARRPIPDHVDVARSVVVARPRAPRKIAVDAELTPLPAARCPAACGRPPLGMA